MRPSKRCDRPWSPVRGAVEAFGRTLISYIRERTGPRREQVERFGTAYRLRRGLDTDRPGYRTVLNRAGTLSTELLRLAGTLNDLTVPADVRTPYRRQRLEAEIARVGRESREQARLVASIPKCEQYDEWIHIADLTIESDTWRWGLRKAPITVASALRELWEDLDSFVLTSATLRVAGEWTYILERLGLEEAEVVDLPTPFTELGRQHMLVVPDHLPTPRGGLLDEFTRAEADEIARLFTLTSGRGLALFTARSRLAFTCDKARPLLDNRGIPLLAQHEQPAPALVERMRADVRASLLATRSFWEGIDIPGEALSLLVVEKLPFDSPDDPIVHARVEALEMRGHDAFTDYVVPTAVLRLVQGIGRLIRTATDVGATVVLDKRLRKPVPYRETFLRSLPGPPRIERPADTREGYEAIARHLDIDLDDGLLADIDAIPSSDSWRFIDGLTLSEQEVTDHAVVGQRLDEVRKQFGFSTWRPGQLDVMKRIIAGEDVLAVLPTGTGKSLAFQIPALLLPGVTLVISPLIALMRDQVRQLHGRGLTRAAALCAGMAQGEQEEILSGARNGRYKILYVSPERLWSRRFRDGLGPVAVARVVVDEAHCISQWGHSFRPEYAAIPDALDALIAKGRPPVAALTATATERVRMEIVKLLRLRDAEAVVRSPDRPELHYWIERCETQVGPRPQDRPGAGGVPRAVGGRLCTATTGLPEDRRSAARRGARRARLPRGHGGARPHECGGGVPLRRDRRGGRHEGVRPGDRQAGHRRHRAPGDAGVGRGVRTGDRSGRTRRIHRHGSGSGALRAPRDAERLPDSPEVRAFRRAPPRPRQERLVGALEP